MSIFENIKKIFENISDLISKFLVYIIPIINNFFIELVDTLFNGDNFKMNISIILVVFLLLYYYIIYVYNLFNIQETKFSYILSISVLGISLTIYYLLIHRNQYKKDDSIDPTSYSKDKNKLYKIKESEKGNKNYDFNMENIKSTLLIPILNSLKYFFSYILIFLVPLLVLILIFYILQNFQNSFTLLKYIFGLTIFITTLAIIAKILGFDNQNNNNFCSKDNLENNPNKDFLSNILNKLKILICIIKNFIFFIPCLLIILIDKLKEDIKLTHSTIFILLLLEIALITMVFFIPMLYKFIIQLNGNDLLGGKGPFYLNEYKVIGTYQELYGQYNDNKKNDSTYYNFNIPFSDEKYNLETIFNGGPHKTKLGDYSYSIYI
tara:strand:+ start:151 stop:1287 length:1137 start_codon:yes stop_codon:yes gene_type:complete